MTLSKALFITTFGHDSDRPQRAALLRMAAVIIPTILCSAGLLQVVSVVPTYAWPGASLLLFPVAVIMQWMIWVALYGTVAITTGQTTTLQHLLHILPLDKRKRQYALILPQIIVAALSLLLVAPSLTYVAHIFGLGYFIALAAAIIGTLSGLGYFLATASLHTAQKFVLLLGVATAEGALTRTLHTVEQPAHFLVAPTLACLIATGCFCLGRIRTARPRHQPRIFFQYPPRAWWYAKKLVRSPIGRTTLVFGCALSVCASYGIYRLQIADSSLSFSIAAMIAASCATDLRSLTRSHHPPEIINLKGVHHFISQVLGSAGVLLLVVSPLLYMALHSAASPHILLGLSQLAVGICAGLGISSLMMPQARDISGQCVTTVLSIGIVGLPQFFGPLQQATPLHTATVNGTIAALCIGILYRAEYKRNPYTWRNA